jgi:hypothetical protein
MCVQLTNYNWKLANLAGGNQSNLAVENALLDSDIAYREWLQILKKKMENNVIRNLPNSPATKDVILKSVTTLHRVLVALGEIARDTALESFDYRTFNAGFVYMDETELELYINGITDKISTVISYAPLLTAREDMENTLLNKVMEANLEIQDSMVNTMVDTMGNLFGFKLKELTSWDNESVMTLFDDIFDSEVLEHMNTGSYVMFDTMKTSILESHQRRIVPEQMSKWNPIAMLVAYLFMIVYSRRQGQQLENQDELLLESGELMFESEEENELMFEPVMFDKSMMIKGPI